MTTKRNKEIKDTIMKKKKKAPPAIYYPTGSDLLDMVVGGTNFGYPGGNIINVVGESNSGKTFLVCELIAAAFNKYGNKLKWIYDDCESGFTFDTEELYGFKVIPDEKDRRHSDTVESLYSVTRDFFENLKKDELGIYTVDSLDGLTSMEMKK